MKRAVVDSIVLSLVSISFFIVPHINADEEWTNLGLYGGQIYEIAIDPDDADKMFAGAYYGDGLYRTLDGGSTWNPVLTGEEDGALDGEATFRNTAVWKVKIAPSSDGNPDNNTVWAVHNYWAAKSTSGGADNTWTHISNTAMQDDLFNILKCIIALPQERKAAESCAEKIEAYAQEAALSSALFLSLSS